MDNSLNNTKFFILCLAPLPWFALSLHSDVATEARAYTDPFGNSSSRVIQDATETDGSAAFASVSDSRTDSFPFENNYSGTATALASPGYFELFAESGFSGTNNGGDGQSGTRGYFDDEITIMPRDSSLMGEQATVYVGYEVTGSFSHSANFTVDSALSPFAEVHFSAIINVNFDFPSSPLDSVAYGRQEAYQYRQVDSQFNRPFDAPITGVYEKEVTLGQPISFDGQLTASTSYDFFDPDTTVGFERELSTTLDLTNTGLVNFDEIEVDGSMLTPDDFYVNSLSGESYGAPIPEPRVSVLIFGLAGLSLAFWSRRKRL